MFICGYYSTDYAYFRIKVKRFNDLINIFIYALRYYPSEATCHSVGGSSARLQQQSYHRTRKPTTHSL